MNRTVAFFSAFMLSMTVIPAFADNAAEMAKKLQDPLANIKALMTDNDVNFNSGNDETSYGFQLQPVYAVPFEDKGFNLVNRAVIPIMGIAPLADKPPILGDQLPPGDDRTWGLSDSLLQFFFSPRTDSAWKWGVGPMFSLPTRTDDLLKGPGWGGGPVAVLVGGSGNLSTAFIAGHLWGEENNFSTSIFQPMLFYNLPNSWTIHYNNTISYDWSADSGNRWTVPVGIAASKTIATKNGHGFEFFVGPYYNVERPEGTADWTIKWGINWLLP